MEFVSANPTGPMHLGNARGGALGDCLAAVLDWAGYNVTREILCERCGQPDPEVRQEPLGPLSPALQGRAGRALPRRRLPGARTSKALAEEFAALHGDALVEAAEEARRAALIGYALPKNIAGLERDLAKYRIHYDVWFRESALHDSGAVQAVVDRLLASGALLQSRRTAP